MYTWPQKPFQMEKSYAKEYLESTYTQHKPKVPNNNTKQYHGQKCPELREQLNPTNYIDKHSTSVHHLLYHTHTHTQISHTAI